MIGKALVKLNQFEKIATSFDDVFIIKKNSFVDERGEFIKSFNQDAFIQMGLPDKYSETYYSTSVKNVLRGMHYQKHPFHHAKLITVIEGEILDVCVNLGIKNKKNKGKYISLVLSKENNYSLFIPDDYAHGFLVLSEKAIVMNQMTSVYNHEYDTGIHFNSFGFKWPIKNPVLSEKDKNLPNIQ